MVSGLDHVRDIGLDLADGRIYWADRDTHKIQRRRLDGTGGIEDLFNVSDGPDRPHGIDLVLSEGMIYWADTQTHAIARGVTQCEIGRRLSATFRTSGGRRACPESAPPT